MHVVPGGIAWAKVRRESDGSFRVAEWRVEPAPGDAAGAARAAADGLSKRGVRGWPAFVAIPDASGSFVTARLLAEEMDLQGDDLVRELHEHTTFEPDAATLRAKHLRNDGRRRVFLVAAIPTAQERLATDPVVAADDGNLGVGFASASAYLGALALGLLPPGRFGVEVMARTTAVYAADPGSVRRYVIAAGAENVARNPAAAEVIAADVRNAAEYHRAQRAAIRKDDASLPEPSFVPLGPLLGEGPLRSALAAHLHGFDERSPAGEPGARVAFDRSPGAALGAVAGAVGAALEGFEPEESRLALRQLPADVRAPSEGAGAAKIAVAACAVAAVAAGAWWFGLREDPSGPPATTPRSGTAAPAIGTSGGPAGTQGDAHPDASQAVVRVTGPLATLARRAAFAAALRDVDATTRGSGGGWARRLAVECDEDSVSVTLTPGADLPQSILARLVDSGNRSVSADRSAVRWKRPVAKIPLPETVADGPMRDVRRAIDAAHASWTSRPASAGARGALPMSWPVAPADVLAAAYDRSPPHGPAKLAWSDGVLAIEDGADPGADASVVAADASVDAAVAGIVSSAGMRPGPGSFIAPAAAPLGVVVSSDHTRIRIAVPPGGEGRRLECRTPGSDAWTQIGPRAGLGTGASEVTHVALGPPGAWTFRVAPSGPETKADLRPDIRVEVLGAVDERTVRLRISVTSDTVTHETSGAFSVGSPLSGMSGADPSGARFPIDAGVRVAAVRVASGLSATIEQVPEFMTDGRVRRDAGGRPVLRETVVERPVRAVEVDLASPSGAVRTVSGKMTDG
ncbi:MAG: hypothetical protein HMLKMBBP_00674 [Planctomycetes bacterium]|nr:hypothetical protein [Planctomycetota bacterium]